MTQDCDILIVGGGINGAGIARDAAGRGYSVILAEMSDLASGTSSASTKLIHGGLRYLEHYEFRLVREALIEREILWKIAPHIIRPLRFVLPHHRGLRPAWLLRLGLFLYDYIAGRKLLPPTRSLDLTRDPAGAPLRDEFVKGFEYSDAWVQDARLVVLNARDAADRGAKIFTRTRVDALDRDEGVFLARLTDVETQTTRSVRARMVVNAAGPWVDEVIGLASAQHKSNVRLVQGSHIVVRRLFDHDRCYIFQNEDGRIIFAIPYEGKFTLIGTTDRDYGDDPARVAITDEETDYLLSAASAYFKNPLSRDDLIWAYSGVRPLFDDGAGQAQQATRDYVLRLDQAGSGPAMIQVFGGKITTYRRLAESAMELIEKQLGKRGKGWTAHSPLPGGDFPVTELENLNAELRRKLPTVPAETVARLAQSYGTLTLRMIDGQGSLGQQVAPGLYAGEIDHLMDYEWAGTADDILWRRSKLGLHLSPDAQAALVSYMANRAGRKASTRQHQREATQ